MFLTKFDFNNEYNIPAAQLDSPNFQDFVNDKEIWALERMLGLGMYNEFVAGLFSSTNPDVPIAEELILAKWKNLRDGTTYFYNSYQHKWVGIKTALRPLIYSLWIRDHAYEWSNTGMVAPASENSEKVSPHRRIADTFNDFSRHVGNLYVMDGTLYGYLYNTYSIDYPTWQYGFNPYGLAMGYISPLFG